MDEIRLAMQKGHRLVKVYEVYEYRVTRYDPQSGDGGLFAQYTDTFLKLEVEASGYPDWVQSDEDEDRYVRDFSLSEGIALDKDAIRPNAAKRGLAKLCLNSMWGKLTERNNRTKTKLITDPLELYRFLSTPGIEVVNLVFANDTVVWASWRFIAEEKVPSLGHTNEVIGAYVTAGARIHLYGYLDKLQEMALYCDTDSVLYIQPDKGPRLVETGDCLGDMTSELQPGHYIEEFVSGGPKNYAYLTVDPVRGCGKTVRNVRGITLNYSVSQLVNFDLLKDMVLNRDETATVTAHTDKKSSESGRVGV